MANKITLDVELKTTINKAQDLYKKIDQGKGFSGALGKEAQAKYKGNWDVIEKLLKQTSLTEDEFKDLNDAIKNVFEVLNTYSSKIETLSEKAIKLQKRLEKKIAERDKAESDRDKQKEKTSNKKVDLIKAIGGKELHSITKSGNLQGGKALLPDTIASKLAKGEKIGYKDSNGVVQEITADSDIAIAAQEYNKAQIALSNFEVSLNNANKAVDSLTDQLNKQIQTDSTKDSSLVSDVLNTRGEVRKGLSIAKEDYTNQKIYEKEAAAAGFSTEINKQQTALGKAFKQFTLYHVALRAVKSALREAVTTVKELDKELTEQAMVTGLTREQTYGLVKSYQDLALQVGATTKEIASVATEYIKQGKSISEAMTLTEAAVSAAKVANVSTADSVNYLTTALNGFQLAAEDAMRVSDKFAAVAAASATDYDELAIALSKVASQANLAGMSIDYTTALLTKGLETTREAPETMGTALKTIIARMRELGDYGETLEGDTDINNVETQLAYVGIALRNTAGELRSTEDVLDELGKKWDTLNKNQQAAVAKALAGTRQQSRLIALMTDYERVTELQEIAQRSAGATAAQASVYLEGMEAALNKITVAWEKIITAATNSEAIINLFNIAGGALEMIGSILDTSIGQVAVYGTLVAIGLHFLGIKTQENQLAKEQRKLAYEELLSRIQERKENIKILLVKKELTKQAKLQAKLENLKAKAAKGQDVTAEIAATEKQIEETKQTIDQKLANSEEYNYLVKQENNLISENNSLMRQGYALQGLMLGGQTAIIAGYKAMVFLKALMGKQDKDAYAAKLKEQAAESSGFRKKLLNAGASMAQSVAAHPFWGWAAALAILAAVGISLGVTIAKNNTAEKKAERTAESINQLSNEIYKLQEKANAIDQITSSFDKLDNKIIKTKKDTEEMNSLLEQVGDQLSTETTKEVIDKVKRNGKVKTKKVDISIGGMSEQEYYNQLPENQKRAFAEEISKQARLEAAEARKKQIELFKKNKDFLDPNTTNSSVKLAQSAIYANAVYNVQEAIDALKKSDDEFTDEIAAATEEVTQALVEAADLNDALDYAENIASIEQLIGKIKDLEVVIQDTNGETKEINASKILTSDDYGLTAKVNAFQEMQKALAGSAEELALLNETYSQYSVFAKMEQDVLNMLEYLEISIDDINQIGNAWETLKSAGLNISNEDFKELITDENSGLLKTLADTGGDIKATVELVFGAIDGYENAYQDIVTALSNVLTIGTLNMGQNFDKLKNTVNSFYEQASKWGDLSETEKTQFMSDHAKLFEENADLLYALESNNWQKLQEILSNSQELKDKIATELKHIEIELSAQEAMGEKANQNYIAWLKQRKAELENQSDFFRADLELLIEQEQKQLDIYKDFLQKQQEQLEESLNKRKEAYEKYFEAIEQQEEDADYKEERDTLIGKISQLMTSTDSASRKQAMELEQQLEEIEKERQTEERQRARDSMLENLDTEVSEINKKFDELLNNEKLLLEALQGNFTGDKAENFLTELIASAREEGMTDLQLEDYINELTSAYGNVIDTSNINEIMEKVINNATINVGDQTFDLNTEDGDSMWQTILAMLIKYGYGR